MSGLKLNKADRDSSIWQHIKIHYEKRLNTLRAKNDNDMTEIETAHLRGRIAEIKALLGEDKEPIQFENQDPSMTREQAESR